MGMEIYFLFGLGILLLIVLFVWFVFIKQDEEKNRILILGTDILLILTSVLVVLGVLYVRNALISQKAFERDAPKENTEQNASGSVDFTNIHDIQEETQETDAWQYEETKQLPEPIIPDISNTSEASLSWENDWAQGDVSVGDNAQENGMPKSDVRESNIEENNIQENNIQENNMQENVIEGGNVQENVTEESLVQPDAMKETYVE